VTTHVVFIAHGSRAAEANDAHRTAAERLAATTGLPVVPAFLELAEPGIGAGIDAAVAAGAERVLVLPHFLYPGRHVQRDIPGEVEEAVARHPEVTVELLGASGADDGVLDLLAAQVRRALG
jgi:sirohydrochlorin cobaltochelatase